MRKASEHLGAMTRQLLLAVGFPMALGDGELFPTSTSSPTTYDCNPYQGVGSLIFGNGNGIQSAECYASWDLHEIRIWDEFGNQIRNLEATSDTGVQSRYEPSLAVDSNFSTFWAGDHDIGMSCECWHAGKQDGQSIRISFDKQYKISKIQLVQGGAGNEWAISKIRIHCGASYQPNPLPLDISFGETDIECNAAGCTTTRLYPAYLHTCDVAGDAANLQEELGTQQQNAKASAFPLNGVISMLFLGSVLS